MLLFISSGSSILAQDVSAIRSECVSDSTIVSCSLSVGVSSVGVISDVSESLPVHEILLEVSGCG